MPAGAYEVPVWLPEDGAYYFSTFGDTLADLNLRNPDVTAQLYDVARFWVQDVGVDGFRLHSVRHLIEEGSDYQDSLPTRRWLRGWDNHLDALDPTLFTVGEVWADTGTQASYVTGDEVYTVFEFPLANGILMSILYQAPGPFALGSGGTDPAGDRRQPSRTTELAVDREETRARNPVGAPAPTRADGRTRRAQGRRDGRLPAAPQEARPSGLSRVLA